MTRRIIFFLFAFFFYSQFVFAHGSMEIPLSRIYNCYKENPESPKSAACRAAIEVGGTGAIYDWNGVNQAAANDRHREIIPDGKLCSGGRDLFKGMDLARSDWVATNISPDSNNQFQFAFHGSAPHATMYFKFYITKESYNPTLPLKWSDLIEEPFCTITNVTLENFHYKLNCPFPPGSGKRVIYTIWQRRDSPEAFYTCTDVVLQSTPTPSPWKELASLFAQNPLNPGTKVKFRLFKNGTEVVTVIKEILTGQTLASQWPYYLARTLNDQSKLVNIGQLDNSGTVTPVLSANLNKVYISDSDLSTYTYSIDFINPADDFEYVYPDGRSTYKANTLVLGFDLRRYQCKPWPASGWCSQSPLYYEPGRGIAWQEAWNVLP